MMAWAGEAIRSPECGAIFPTSGSPVSAISPPHLVQPCRPGLRAPVGCARGGAKADALMGCADGSQAWGRAGETLKSPAGLGGGGRKVPRMRGYLSNVG